MYEYSLRKQLLAYIGNGGKVDNNLREAFRELVALSERPGLHMWFAALSRQLKILRIF